MQLLHSIVPGAAIAFASSARVYNRSRDPGGQVRGVTRNGWLVVSSTTTKQFDHYEMLGVSYQATPEEITRAYRGMMKRCHPDKLAPELRGKAEEQCRLLNESYRILSKPESKAQYDQQLKATMVQDQIMGRYAEGLGGASADDDIYAWLRDLQKAEQRKMRKQSDRQATSSLFIVFVGFALIVLFLLVLGSVAGSLLHQLG